MSEKKKVMVCVPTGDKWIHATVVSRLLQMMGDDRHALTVGFHSATPSEYCRNAISKMALDAGSDYLLMIDDDNPPMKNVLDLVELDLDVIGLPTPMWKTPAKDGKPMVGSPIAWNVAQTKPGEDRYDFAIRGGSGLDEVDAVGTGCILIARRVLEHPDLRAPFLRVFDEDGMVSQGSDLHFCDRVRAAGFTIWTHWDYPCGHFKETNLAEVMPALRSPLEQMQAALGTEKERPANEERTGSERK